MEAAGGLPGGGATGATGLRLCTRSRTAGPVPVHDRGLAAATEKKARQKTLKSTCTHPRRPQGAGQGRACPPRSRPTACKGTATWHTGAGTSSHTQHTRWRRHVDSTNNTIDRSKERLDPKTPKGRSHHPTACAQYLFGGSGQQGPRRDTRCGHSRAKHTRVGAWKGSGRTRSSLYQ
jgi:hypothetical protein